MLPSESGKAGVPGFGVGAYGDGTVNCYFEVLPNPNIDYVTLTLDYGVFGEFLFYVVKYEIDSHTWQL